MPASSASAPDNDRLPHDATQEFRLGQYAASVSLLERLASADRPRLLGSVQANLVVARYYAGGSKGSAEAAPSKDPTPGASSAVVDDRQAFVDPVSLLEAMDSVLGLPEPPVGSSDPLLIPSSEDEDDADDPFLAPESHPTSTAPSPTAGADSTPAEARTPVARASTYYNRAVVLLHLGRFTEAAHALEPVLSALDTVDGYIGLRACLLVAECWVAAGEPKRALAVASLIEMTFAVEGGDGELVEGSGAPAETGADVARDMLGTARLRRLPDSFDGNAGVSGSSDPVRSTPSPERFGDERSGRDSDDAGSDAGGASASSHSGGGRSRSRQSDFPSSSPLAGAIRGASVSSPASSTPTKSHPDPSSSPTVHPPSLQDALPRTRGSLRSTLAILRARCCAMQGADAPARRLAALALETSISPSPLSDTPSPLTATDPPNHIARSTIHPDASLAPLYLDARADYLEGNLDRAMQTLDAARSIGDSDRLRARLPEVAAIADRLHSNALGCLYARAGKHSLAAACFSKAIDANTRLLEGLEKRGNAVEDELEEWERNLGDDDDDHDANGDSSTAPSICPPLLLLLLDQSAPILYNAGIQMLLANRPDVAIGCFERALRWVDARGGERVEGGDVSLVPGIPRGMAWLRMGECCIKKWEAIENSGLQ
ncbi:hypothetical protein BDK51DRAFT_51295, partial [Blyttiomyces helicus]